MIIGIDASRAFLPKRTGIEEYSYQVVKHLRDTLSPEIEVRLYMRPGQGVDFTIPKNWKVKRLFAPYLWTQGRLSLEMLLHRPDVLFVPAHIVPLFHPRKTVVTMHGLEYEFSPESYSIFERLYMRWSIRFSCLVSRAIIAVSENTKKDLQKLYSVSEEKIVVIPEGFERERAEGVGERGNSESPFFLFIGRLEARKNIVRIIEAFEEFKEKTRLPHTLVLAGKWGYGRERIEEKIASSSVKNDITLTGYISENEKWGLLANADAFLFPTLYEGFGLPVLEAQAVGTVVITSNTSSLPEVAGQGALFVDPLKAPEIAEAMERLVTDPRLQAGIIEKATQNVKRFSWEECARKIHAVLLRA